jgi:hypothetical protein
LPRTDAHSLQALYLSSIKIDSDPWSRFARRPASLSFSKARKGSAAPQFGQAQPPTLHRIRAGLGACDPAWSPDGRRLAVTAAEGLWVFPSNSAEGALRVESRLPLGSIEFNYRAFSSPRWSPDGTLLGIVVTNGGTSWVEVFDANTGRLFYTSPPENDTFTWTAAAAIEARRPRNSPAQMTPGTVRHAYLDWVRGVGVLIMIEAHVLDAWTSAADRTRPVFGYAMILGGFGAPLFMFLAGVAVALSGESKFRKTGRLRRFVAGSAEARMANLRPRVPLPASVLHPQRWLQRTQPVESRHPQCDGPCHCLRGADGAYGPEQNDARRALCGGRGGNIPRRSRRPRDASAGVAP